MSTIQPLDDDLGRDADDRALVTRAQAGDRDAREDLVRRHQRWIYNIAIRMLAHPEDAHVLNMKRGRVEHPVSFREYGEGLDQTPDLELADHVTVAADLRLLVDEARIGCTSAMLLCLDREQRLIYVLGEIFDVSDTIGAKLLDTTPDNFRQRLARARRDLHSFMNDKCGLVNQSNPCRCVKKTVGFIRGGHVDPRNLLFASARIREVRDVAPTKAEALATLDQQYADVFRRHPFYEAQDLVPALRRLLESPEYRRATELP